MRQASRFSVLVAAFLSLGPATPGHADPLTISTLGWAVNGIVSEVVRAGDTVFIGGSFGSLAPSENLVFNVAAFSTTSARPVLPRLAVNGRVRAVVAAPGGGWIIGGEFTQVNGLVRQRLAKLRADGTVDPAFSASANDTVWAFAVSGNTIYAGGEFSTVNGSGRAGLVALDAATGALDATFVPSVNGGATPAVFTLAVSGARLHVGGRFTTVNGVARQNLVALDATTGVTVAGFTGEADGRVDALAVSGSALFAAGAFQNVGGLARRGVARLDAATGVATPGFDAQATTAVSALAVTGTTVFVGGSFSQMGGASRANLAQLDAASGAATSWNPGANGDVHRLALSGTTLVAAGQFTEIGGEERLRLGALTTSGVTGLVQSWNPSLDSGADTLSIDASGTIFVGGSFNYFGAVPRVNAAALDLRVGSLLPWNPAPDGWVRALDLHDHTVFIGGDFMHIGGAERHFVAALDAVTGDVVPTWNPRPDQRVNGLQVLGSTVYFVGDFEHVGGTTSRGHGAAASLDGTVLAWNPQTDDSVEALFAIGTRVYLGGAFSMVGGSARSRLAAVDAVSGAVASGFAPTVTGATPIVYRVDVQGDAVFFGGRFSMVAGTTRNNAAAVKHAPGAVDDGALLGWHPDVSGEIYDLDAFGDDVYLAGSFGTVGGVSRPGIARVDAGTTGSVRAWRPDDVAGGSVSVIDTSDEAVLFGGLLYDLNYLYIGAVLYPESSLPGVPAPPTAPRARVTGSGVTIDWRVPSMGSRPTGYVIEAGTGAGLSNLVNGSTGSSATTIAGSGLPPGAYYYRLRAGNAYGVSGATEEQAFVIGAAGCTAPPAAPTDLVAVVQGSVVTLTWRTPAASAVSNYRLTAGVTSGGREVGSFDVGPATSYSTVVAGGAFFVTVQASNACGLGPSSAQAVVIVGAPIVPPTAPFALDVTRVGSTVTFTWGAPSIGTGPFTYRLEAGSSPGLSDLATVVSGVPTLTVPGVPPGIYYVRVRAAGSGGLGPAGNELTVVVP